VVKPDAVLQEESLRGVKRAQIAAAAWIIFDRQTGIDNRPVRSQSVRHLSKIVVARSVECREEAVIALDALRVGEVVSLRQQNGGHAGACRVARVNALAPGAEVLRQPSGV